MTDKQYNPVGPCVTAGRPLPAWVEQAVKMKPSETLRVLQEDGNPFDRYSNVPSTDSAFDKQVAGSHYKGMKIQPMEYALANNLGYCEATALKYISRWKLKGGIADLDKAIHFLELLKEYASKHPEEFGL